MLIFCIKKNLLHPKKIEVSGRAATCYLRKVERGEEDDKGLGQALQVLGNIPLNTMIQFSLD